ncbi:hypothetical protein M1394_00420 [Candidatus Marsarchaeota archaeon]|nr:hypothetical protein [Candidatus Marsarchaeota archaeon]
MANYRSDCLINAGEDMRPIMVALGVVILSISAIIAFVLSGAGIAFYVIAVIAICLGFYMSYLLKEEERGSKQKQRKASR